MGNIVGEGFDSRIRKQVERRQKTHGSGYNNDLRTHEQLAVLNNNTAWIKLMSSVSIDNLNDINNPTIKSFDRKGADIARAFVLFNGTSKYDTTDGTNYTTTQREGIDFENTLGGRDSVYGIGGSVDFGLNPMMGITGIDVKHKNRGSIRTATVTVKAFNRTQFEIIDVLYMRLGFSVLLEWGNSIYIDNDGKYISDGGQKNSLIDFWFKNSDYQKCLSEIRLNSFESHGNYDAMLAKVSNYHWSFQKDGSYDITIDLVSMGDVIESLNAGNFPNSIEENRTEENNSSRLAKRLQKAKLLNKWGEEFTSVYGKLSALPRTLYDGFGSTKKFENLGFGDQIQYVFLFGENKDLDSERLYIKLGKILHILDKFINLKSNDSNGNTKTLNFNYDYRDNLIEIIKTKITPLTEIEINDMKLMNGLVINQMSYNPNICVTLKEIYYCTTEYHENPNDYGIKVNTSFSNEFNTLLRQNIGPYYSNNFSDIYAPINFGIKSSKYPSENFDTTLSNYPKNYYGRIMNILVNVEFVLDVIDNKINKETGELPLIDFLKGILAGINESLGGINELDVFIDETTNTVKIIDKNSSGERSTSTSTVFNLYGYNKDKDNISSNFIHDFNLTTEITPALSTMITVAATANKTVVGEDNTALSKINKGLSDRYKVELTSDDDDDTVVNTYIIDPTDSDYIKQFTYFKLYHLVKTSTFLNNDETKLENLFNRTTTEEDLNIPPGTFESSLFLKAKSINISNSTDLIPARQYLFAAYGLDNFSLAGPTSFFQYIYNMSLGKWNDIDNANSFTNKFQDINKKWNYLQNKEKSNPTFKSGFIPFNLSLTMDGLGGMKIYQKFSVDTNFMPSNYPQNIEFLIKNIQHTVKDNKWTTKLESFCVSKPGSKISTPTPNVTGPGLNLGNKIVISAAYSKNNDNSSTNVIYTAKIESGQSAPKDIEITFTDTLTNKTKTNFPLSVTLTILKNNNEVTFSQTFPNVPYDSIETT